MLKSFLHQSSDIYRAINEAWEQSEKPTVFTVKIIDPGKKGFLGFSHRDAIISFTYECNQPCAKPANQLRQVTSKPESSAGKNSNNNRPQPNNLREPKNQPQIKATTGAAANNTQKPAAENKPKTPQAQNVNPAKPPQAKVAPKPQQAKNPTPAQANPAPAADEVWTEALATEATAWLNGFFKVLGTETTIQVVETKNELLTISATANNLEQTLAGSLFKDNLFACASATLAVQSLRNKNSQRFKGLKIKIIT